MQVVGPTRHVLSALVLLHVFLELTALPSPTEGLAHAVDDDHVGNAAHPDGRLIRREVPSSLLAEKERGHGAWFWGGSSDDESKDEKTAKDDDDKPAASKDEKPATSAESPAASASNQKTSAPAADQQAPGSAPPAAGPAPPAPAAAWPHGPPPPASTAASRANQPQPPAQQSPPGAPATQGAAPPPAQTDQGASPPPAQTAQPAQSPPETAAAQNAPDGAAPAAASQQQQRAPANPIIYGPPPPPPVTPAQEPGTPGTAAARGASPAALSGQAQPVVYAPPAGPGGPPSGSANLNTNAPPASPGHQPRAAALLAVTDPVAPPAASASFVDAAAEENAFFAAVGNQIKQAWFLHGDPLFIMVGTRPYLLSPSKDAPVKNPQEVATELGETMQDPLAIAQAAYSKNVANMLLWVSDLHSLRELAKDFNTNIILNLQMRSKLRGFYNGKEHNKDTVLQMDHADLIKLGWSTLWARGGMGREGVLRLAMQENSASSVPSGSAALLEKAAKAESELRLEGSEDELATQAKELLLALAPSN